MPAGRERVGLQIQHVFSPAGSREIPHLLHSIAQRLVPAVEVVPNRLEVREPSGRNNARLLLRIGVSLHHQLDLVLGVEVRHFVRRVRRTPTSVQPA